MRLRSDDRSGLILLAKSQATSRACKRAFETGKVVVLGGFDPLLPSTAPGWVVSVTSKHGRTWLLAVITDDLRHTCRTFEIDTVPWEHYSGFKGFRDSWIWPPPYHIHDGDHPLHAKSMWRARRKELENAGKTSG